MFGLCLNQCFRFKRGDDNRIKSSRCICIFGLCISVLITNVLMFYTAKTFFIENISIKKSKISLTKNNNLILSNFLTTQHLRNVSSLTSKPSPQQTTPRMKAIQNATMTYTAGDINTKEYLSNGINVTQGNDTIEGYDQLRSAHSERFSIQANAHLVSNINDLESLVLHNEITQLKQIRSTLVRDIYSPLPEWQWLYPIDSSKSTQVILGHQPGWFNKLDENQNTVFSLYINKDLDELKSVMFCGVYKWAVNSCKELYKKEVNNRFNTSLYGTSCAESMATVWTQSSLEPRYMLQGLPNGYIHPDEKVTLTHLHILKYAIVNETGDVFVNNVKIVGNRCPEKYTKEKYSTTFPTIKEQKESQVYDEVFTITQYWGTKYFHFLVEVLPRIVPFLTFLVQSPSIKIHIPGYEEPYLKQLSTHFKLNESRFITGLVRARILYLPQSGPCGSATVFNSRLQSMIQRSLIPQDDQPRNIILLIKRSLKRYFTHHDEILSALKAVVLRRNAFYRVDVFDDNPLPSLEDTMRLFNRAFIVIAPHGAGESNMLYSEPGTLLIEGLCNPVNACYRNLMHVLGHRYYGIYYNKRDCMTMTADDVIKPLEQYLDVILD